MNTMTATDPPTASPDSSGAYSSVSIYRERAVGEGPPPARVCMLFLETPARTESRVMRDATALVEAGYEVTLIDIEEVGPRCIEGGTRGAEEEIRGVRFKHIFSSNWYRATRFKPWYLVKLAGAIVRSTLRAVQTPADIYHAHNERALPAGYIAARLRRKPLIFDAPELTLDELPYSRWRILKALATRVVGAMTPYCAGVIATSPLHARKLRETFHIPEVTLVRNVPPYRAVPESERLRQQLGLSPSTRIALYQGNLQPNRGLQVLVRAARFLEQDIVIVIMGSGSRDIPAQLHSLVASEGVADRVKIMPPAPYKELLDWTASADIGLTVYPLHYSPNVQTSLPNKLFEYLMAGLPVLTSELDAVAELVRTYDVGRVVPSVEPEQVAAAMNALLTDQEGLARMRHNALEVARNEFCWEKEGQRLFDLYKEILSVGTGGAEDRGGPAPCVLPGRAGASPARTFRDVGARGGSRVVDGPLRLPWYGGEGPRVRLSRSPLRVCMHVLGAARSDGRVIRAATALEEAGVAVSIVDIESNSRHSVEVIRNVRLKHVEVPAPFMATRFRRWGLLKACWLFLRSTRLLLQTPADIYHAHDATALPACYIAAHLRHKALIFDAHELPLKELEGAHRRWLRALLTPLLSAMIRHASGIITASPLYAREIRTRYAVGNVALVRNLPPYRTVTKNERLRQQLGLSPSTRIALYQGNLQPDRGLDVLVRAASCLKQDSVIVMMGNAVEETLAHLQALIASEGVASRVKILPAVPYAELLDWTASADIGLNVLPPDYSRSIQLCLPNKLFEYLMAGLPVLTSQLDAVADIVRTYDVGQVVSSLAPRDVAAAIDTLLADDAALARMRRNALEAAQNEFCWEKEKEQLYRFYQKRIRFYSRRSRGPTAR